MTDTELIEYISALKKIKCFRASQPEQGERDWKFEIINKDGTNKIWFYVFIWHSTVECCWETFVDGKTVWYNFEDILQLVPPEIGMELLFHIDLLNSELNNK